MRVNQPQIKVGSHLHRISAFSFSIRRKSEAVDLIVSNRPSVVGYSVTAVAFYGVDVAALDLFDDSNVVCDTILAVGFGLVPIEVDNVTGIGGIGFILPLIAGSEPAFAGDTACGFGNEIGVDIATPLAHQETKQAHHSTLDSKPI